MKRLYALILLIPIILTACLSDPTAKISDNDVTSTLSSQESSEITSTVISNVTSDIIKDNETELDYYVTKLSDDLINYIVKLTNQEFYEKVDERDFFEFNRFKIFQIDERIVVESPEGVIMNLLVVNKQITSMFWKDRTTMIIEIFNNNHALDFAYYYLDIKAGTLTEITFSDQMDINLWHRGKRFALQALPLDGADFYFDVFMEENNELKLLVNEVCRGVVFDGDKLLYVDATNVNYVDYTDNTTGILFKFENGIFIVIPNGNKLICPRSQFTPEKFYYIDLRTGVQKTIENVVSATFIDNGAYVFTDEMKLYKISDKGELDDMNFQVDRNNVVINFYISNEWIYYSYFSRDANEYKKMFAKTKLDGSETIYLK